MTLPMTLVTPRTLPGSHGARSRTPDEGGRTRRTETLCAVIVALVKSAIANIAGTMRFIGTYPTGPVSVCASPLSDDSRQVDS